MAYQYFNPNPLKKNVGDCVVRALAMAFDISWSDAYTEISLYGLEKSDIPSSNSLWGSYLKENGFKAKIMPDSCPDCYTIKQFAFDHPKGIYVVATGSHVVAVVNGDYYDSWDSGDEIVAYYFEKENTDELSNV